MMNRLQGFEFESPSEGCNHRQVRGPTRQTQTSRRVQVQLPYRSTYMSQRFVPEMGVYISYESLFINEYICTSDD